MWAFGHLRCSQQLALAGSKFICRSLALVRSYFDRILERGLAMNKELGLNRQANSSLHSLQAKAMIEKGLIREMPSP